MREQPDLCGEIHENEIVKIAWEAVGKRGYAIWDDFDEYIKKIVARNRLKLSGWDVSIVKSNIRKTLKAAGWKRRKVHSEIRFYPPGTEFSKMELFEGKG